MTKEIIIKIIVATLLLAYGIFSFVLRVKKYRKNFHNAIKEDLIDSFFFLPGIIFELLLILIGIAWLIYLLSHL
ncbi:MAG: hypothetical protein C4550_06710 [Nitrospiraceae bacterium]|nr:MAG: hypothetical protein C4550_06710 [Nitrospiraceae bacterium]